MGQQRLGPAGTRGFIDHFLPIVADAEAGFGGVLNAFELMKGMMKRAPPACASGRSAGVREKCGHMGGKVLVPTQEACKKLIAARWQPTSAAPPPW